MEQEALHIQKVRDYYHHYYKRESVQKAGVKVAEKRSKHYSVHRIILACRIVCF